MFNPSQGDDIKKFISNVNGLADQARILQSERKSILQERVPASMGPNLLTLSKDDDVSYEKLCQHVADAAYTRQRLSRSGASEPLAADLVPVVMMIVMEKNG
ncbi:hypothetical protein E4U45_005161 [Claviceps purpurea]|nr:hypothetical protein E4U45_005161 [Claviceps purpurea]